MPLPRSYQQGHRCLEQEDWEVAVLFFSRALHLDSQMVRGTAWEGDGPLPVAPAGLSSQSH